MKILIIEDEQSSADRLRRMLEGEPMEQVARRFADYVIAVANGEKTNNEKNGYHEIAIFKNGVTL